jgi:hypothetical protein
MKASPVAWMSFFWYPYLLEMLDPDPDPMNPDPQHWILTCGMPMMLKQASICWATSGFVGAMNTIFP